MYELLLDIFVGILVVILSVLVLPVYLILSLLVYPAIMSELFNKPGSPSFLEAIKSVWGRY